MKKFNKKKKLSLKLINCLTVMSLTFTSLFSCIQTPYERENLTFSYDDVSQRIKYWGGDDRFIDQRLGFFKLKKNNLASHYENTKSAIIVGYSSNFTEEQKQQFNYVVNYYNELFSVINPEYRFITKTCNSNECDIFIDTSTNLPDTIYARVWCERDKLDTCAINGATIHFNINHKFHNGKLRVCLAHEFMHILYGSSDLEDQLYSTFSVYNYLDTTFMSYIFENAYEPKNESELNKPQHLTKEQKNSFITLAPTDVATLIAIYGDHTSDKKHDSYVDLLNKTLQTCKTVFGDEKYFKNGFEMPQKRIKTNDIEKTD